MPKHPLSHYVEKYGDLVPGKIFLQYEGEGAEVSILDDTPVWPVPEKVAIICAPTGAFFDRSQNEYQLYTSDEIRDESIAAVENGACSIHVQVRDEATGAPSNDIALYHKIISPLRERFGDGVVIDGNAQIGPTSEVKSGPVLEGLLEVSPVNTTAVHVSGTILGSTRQVCQFQTEMFQDYGCKPQIAVHDSGHVENAKRWLIDSGILKKPYYWIIVPAIPGSLMMTSPLQMVEGLALMARRIYDIDPESHICVTMGGRASGYVIAQALLMGMHVRVGMEDTIYRYPHRPDLLKSNADCVKWTADLARMLGREPMAAQDYRDMLDIKALG